MSAAESATMSGTMRGAHALGYHTTRRKRSGKHEARWADETGHVRARSFPDKMTAQKFSEDRAAECLKIAVGLGTARRLIADAVIEFQSRRLQNCTVELNGRRIREFLSSFPKLVYVSEITDSIINEYDRKLEARGCNPGGRKHHLKIVRAFCHYCLDKQYLSVDPFHKFKMPKPDFEGRALTEEEFERMCSIGWVGGNEVAAEHGIGWSGANQHGDVDLWLRRALILGRETMLRISQVFKLTPADFREPGEIHVDGIKGQETEWKPLTPKALGIVRELLAATPKPDGRFFSHWKSLAAMRQAVQKKATRVGLEGVRFHDAGKVSRVTALDKAGFSVKEIEQLSNTTARTLLAHYIKPKLEDTVAKYNAFSGGRPTLDQPGTKNSGTPAQNDVQSGSSDDSGESGKSANSR